MLIGPSENIANNGKGMYVGLKQPLGDGERCVTPARAAAKETSKPCSWANICCEHQISSGNLSHDSAIDRRTLDYCLNCGQP